MNYFVLLYESIEQRKLKLKWRRYDDNNNNNNTSSSSSDDNNNNNNNNDNNNNNSWQLCSCIEGLGRSRCFIGKSDDAIGLKRPEQLLNDSLGYLHAKSLVQSKWMTAAMLCGAFGSTGGMTGRAMWAMFFRRWWQTFFKFFVVDPMSRGTPGRTIRHQLVADQRCFVFVPSCIHLWKWAG